ncbi:uncharacterized protein LOC127192044 [Acomys russatus]|uniref:uncharacterized protein LOC127192044 n=1 Tax=Acomys russatus TaxID=60746 RepID=UPI0021E21089|nr:uncharacterized protein LOC127192044 [Acomys russatus]
MMTTKDIFPAYKPLTYVLLPTSSEASKPTTKSSKANKSKGSFFKTQGPVKTLSKWFIENCGFFLYEPKNFYCLDLCPLASSKLLDPEPQIHVPIPEATETCIHKDSIACAVRKNVCPALCYPRNAHTPSVVKVTSADAMKVPSANILKVSSTDAMKVPSADAMKVPSADAMRVPSADAMRVPSADAMRVPSADAMKVPSADAMRVHSANILKVPSADAMRVPSANILKVPSADAMRVPSADAMRVPSANILKVPSADAMRVPSADAMRVPSANILKVPSADAMRIPSADAMRIPSANILKVPSASVVKTSSSVASKLCSAWATKPRIKTQLKNQEKQDEEKLSFSLDLVLVNPNQSTLGIQHFPIPEATKVIVPRTQVIYRTTRQ